MTVDRGLSVEGCGVARTLQEVVRKGSKTSSIALIPQQIAAQSAGMRLAI